MTRDKILAELRKAPKTTQDLMAALNLSYDTVHNSLKRLAKSDVVAKLDDGHYALVEKVIQVDAKGQVTEKTPRPKVPGFLPKAKKLKNEFIYVVDVSYSMNPVASDALRGLNQSLDTVRSEAEKSGQETLISLYYFADTTRREFHRVPAAKVPRQTSYVTRGYTALFDAVNEAVAEHERVLAMDEDVAYVVIVITDGDDNRSRDSWGEAMKRNIARVQGTDRWTVTFQVPRGQKQSFCQKFGVPAGNVTEWESTTTEGVEKAATHRHIATKGYFSARASGMTSMNSFYVQPDLSDLTAKDLKKNLTNIADQVSIWEVPREVDIKEFVESKAGFYRPGTAFYELTKAEKIQPYKQLLVQERGKRAVYAGDEARQLLGFPSGVNVKFKPGNHGDFVIFGQSTSNNRKLVRGSHLVHWPKAA